MKIKRTWFASDKTGFHMLHTLFQTSLKYDPIERYDEWFVPKLLLDDGRCQGLVAIQIATGRAEPVLARSVILRPARPGAPRKVSCEPPRRHRAIEFPRFLARSDREVPADLHVHLVLDNYGAHKTPRIQRWLLRHPRF